MTDKTVDLPQAPPANGIVSVIAVALPINFPVFSLMRNAVVAAIGAMGANK